MSASINTKTILRIISLLLILFWIFLGVDPALGQDLSPEGTKDAKLLSEKKERAEFEIMVVAKQPGALIAMYNTLNGPVDEDSLVQLGDYCYTEVKGNSYQRVMISWFLPDQPKDGTPWAITNYGQGFRVIEVLNKSLADKYPALKAWSKSDLP